jgi:iron complex outermembrane receptor protein
VYSASQFILGNSRLAVKLGMQRSRRAEFGHPQSPGTPALRLELSTYTYDVKFSLPETGKWAATFGANGMFQDNRNKGATEFVIPDYTAFDIGPFVFVKRTFGKLDFAAGARYDIRSFHQEEIYTRPNEATGFEEQVSFVENDTLITKQFDAYDHTFSGFSGSVGATYNFSEKLCVKVNVARGYRSPNIAEISAKGVHPGTGFQQLGDANFKPEFNLQEDVGLFFSVEHVSGSIELFNNNISNYIYNEKLSSVNGGDSIFVQGGNEYQVFHFRQTNAQLYGGEFSIDLHPHPLDWLHFENSVSVLYAVNRGGNGANITDSTKYLPFIPPFHTISELRADLGKRMGAFSGFYAKFGLEYYAAQNRIFSAYGTETPTPGYVLLNAGIGADILNSNGKTMFSFSVNATNLADVAYQSNMSRLKYMEDYPGNGSGRSGIYNMGRNFSFRIVIPFEARTKAG